MERGPQAGWLRSIEYANGTKVAVDWTDCSGRTCSTEEPVRQAVSPSSTRATPPRAPSSSTRCTSRSLELREVNVMATWPLVPPTGLATVNVLVRPERGRSAVTAWLGPPHPGRRTDGVNRRHRGPREGQRSPPRGDHGTSRLHDFFRTTRGVAGHGYCGSHGDNRPARLLTWSVSTRRAVLADGEALWRALTRTLDGMQAASSPHRNVRAGCLCSMDTGSWRWRSRRCADDAGSAGAMATRVAAHSQLAFHAASRLAAGSACARVSLHS